MASLSLSMGIICTQSQLMPCSEKSCLKRTARIYSVIVGQTGCGCPDCGSDWLYTLVGGSSLRMGPDLRPCVSFLRLPQQNTASWVAVKSRKLLSYGSGVEVLIAEIRNESACTVCCCVLVPLPLLSLRPGSWKGHMPQVELHRGQGEYLWAAWPGEH